MGAWRYRVVRDSSNKLHFAFVRYDEFGENPNGMVNILNEGRDIKEMRALAEDLARACDDPIVSTATLRAEDGSEDENEQDEYDDDEE